MAVLVSRFACNIMNDVTFKTIIIAFPTLSSSAVGVDLVILGSILGGTVLFIMIFIALSVVIACKAAHRSAPIRANSTTGRYTTMSYRPRPEQSSVSFNLSQPLSEEPDTRTQLTDSDFTKAPPPAYDIHENFTEYRETLPPSYSEVGDMSSQPLSAAIQLSPYSQS